MRALSITYVVRTKSGAVTGRSELVIANSKCQATHCVHTRCGVSSSTSEPRAVMYLQEFTLTPWVTHQLHDVLK